MPKMNNRNKRHKAICKNTKSKQSWSGAIVVGNHKNKPERQVPGFNKVIGTANTAYLNGK